MSRQIRVLTQELSGNFQIALNGKPYAFTDDMLTNLSSSATTLTDEKIQRLLAIEAFLDDSTITKLSALANTTSVTDAGIQYLSVEITKN